MSITDFEVIDRGEKHGGRYEFIVNKPLAIVGNAVFVVESFFSDSKTEPKGFHGATGYYMRPIYQDEVDEYQDDPDEELWKMAVADDQTTDGLDEWWKKVCQEAEDEGRLYPSDDDSFRDDFQEVLDSMSEEKMKAIDLYALDDGEDEEPVAWTCQGCGRCLEFKNPDYIFDEELFQLVQKYEE